MPKKDCMEDSLPETFIIRKRFPLLPEKVPSKDLPEDFTCLIVDIWDLEMLLLPIQQENRNTMS